MSRLHRIEIKRLRATFRIVVLIFDIFVNNQGIKYDITNIWRGIV